MAAAFFAGASPSDPSDAFASAFAPAALDDEALDALVRRGVDFLAGASSTWGGPAGADTRRDLGGSGAWKMTAVFGRLGVVLSSLTAGTSDRERPHAVSTSLSFVSHAP